MILCFLIHRILQACLLQISENTREISEIKETMVTKDAGNKITTISKADNKKLYYPMIEDLLLQPALRLR